MTDKSTRGKLAIRYEEMDSVYLKMASVMLSGAGPPFEQLYLMPKSASGPPGLWLAVKMIPAKCGKRAKKEKTF
jgi:hypothetical protein